MAALDHLNSRSQLTRRRIPPILSRTLSDSSPTSARFLSLLDDQAIILVCSIFTATKVPIILSHTYCCDRVSGDG